MPINILLIGNLGQVGWELQRTLATLGNVTAVDQPQIELTDSDSIRRTIAAARPLLVVNAAAYTAVDKAEDEPGLAMQINAVAPAVMAEEAKRLGAAFITYSTDYVFDGANPDPYTELDRPNPLGVYGRTKLAGDVAVESMNHSSIIFRTSWVFGSRGKNFVLTMLHLAAEREELKVIDDQFGAPTWSRALAEATAQIIAQVLSPARNRPAGASVADRFADFKGIYNITAGGRVSWFGIARMILSFRRPDTLRKLCSLVPITAAEYPARAQRPQNSMLSNRKLADTFGLALPSWDNSLRLVMQELGCLPEAHSAAVLTCPARHDYPEKVHNQLRSLKTFR